MNEKLIQKALFRKFFSHRYKFANVFYFQNESDFLSFLPNGFCYEVEIKISRSDFKADFKKQKHAIHSENSNGRKYYIDKTGNTRLMNPTWEFCRDFPELVIAEEYRSYRRNSTYNEFDIRLSFIPYSRIEFRAVQNESLPNKFFYAVPAGLISKDEVPEYAGLLYINEDLSVTKIKDAKFIHKDVLKPEKIFNKAYHAYESELWRKLNNIKNTTNV